MENNSETELATEQDLETPISAGSPKPEKPQEPEGPNHLPFFQSLPQLLKKDTLLLNSRLTPRGLFITIPLVPEIISAYQKYCAEIAKLPAIPSDQKSFKRLFVETPLHPWYLVESKRALLGFLIPTAIANPAQIHGIPPYLGSLDDARKIIHPRDDSVQKLKGVQLSSDANGMVVNATLPGLGALKIPQQQLAEFSRLAGPGTPPVLASFEVEYHAALRDCIEPILTTISRAREINAEQRLLLPARLLRRNDINYLIDRAVVFAIHKKGELWQCYERDGRGLMTFIKKECTALAAHNNSRHIGVIHLDPRARPHLGSLTINGQRHELSLHAMTEFVRAVVHNPPDEKVRTIAPNSGSNSAAPAKPALPPKDRWLRFSVRECLEELSELLIRAAPVDPRLFEKYLGESVPRGSTVLNNQRWIFLARSTGTGQRHSRNQRGGRQRRQAGVVITRAIDKAK